MLEKRFFRVSLTNDQQCLTHPVLFASHDRTLQLGYGTIGACHVFGVQVVIGTYTLDAVESPGVALAVIVLFDEYYLCLMQQT